MRTIIHEVPYHTWKKEQVGAEQEFNREMLLADLMSPLYNIIFVFDKGKQISINYKNFQAKVENPSQDFIKKSIADYISDNKNVSGLNESKSHHLNISNKGRLSLRFLANGHELINAAEGDTTDVYVDAFRKKGDVKKYVELWERIAVDLDFEPIKHTVDLAEDCKAVKICNRIMDLNKDALTLYVNDKVLKTIRDLNSKLVLTNKITSFALDKKGIVVETCFDAKPTRQDYEHLLNLMWDGKKEPNVKWGVEVKTWLDALREFYRAHQGKLVKPMLFSAVPAAATTLCAIIADVEKLDVLSYAKTGFLYGLAFDVVVGGSFYGYVGWRDYKANKRREREEALKALAERARKEKHDQIPYACAFITTNKCAIKASKEQLKTKDKL
jgi:hypothetical protein